MMSPAYVNDLMSAFRGGDVHAGAKLTELFYPELKRMAVAKMRGERDAHSWQPTLLVNELYMQLMKIRELPQAECDRQNDRAAFFSLAGQIMKRLLIRHARLLSAQALKVEVGEDIRMVQADSLGEVEAILDQLASIKPILRTVVEMKVFEGRTSEEIAGVLGCSTVTIHRHWQFARHWLKEQWEPTAG